MLSTYLFIRQRNGENREIFVENEEDSPRTFASVRVYGFSFHLQRQHENISKHYLSLFASRSGHRFPSLCLSFHFDVEIPALGSDICYLLNEMIYTGVSLVMLCCTYINTYSKAGQRCVYLMRQCHCHFASTNAHS